MDYEDEMRQVGQTEPPAATYEVFAEINAKETMTECINAVDNFANWLIMDFTAAMIERGDDDAGLSELAEELGDKEEEVVKAIISRSLITAREFSLAMTKRENDDGS